MTFLQFNERVNFFLTCAVAFLIPAYPSLVAPCIILLAANWISVPKLILNGFSTIKNTKPILFLIFLFLFYIIGMLYTSNYKFGSETIETKLSFIALPLVFSTQINSIKKNLNSFLKLFVIGCSINAIVCFIWASYRFYKPVYVILYDVPYNLGSSYFYYQNLSVFMHPSYSSMYSVFALIALFYLYKQNNIKLNWLWYLVISLLVVFILLLSSKAGWLGLFSFVIYFSSILIRKKRAKLVIGIALILSVLFYVFNVSTTHRFLIRIPQFSKIIEAIKGSDKESNKVTTSTDGTGSRILVWKAALEVISENFWTGTGTGDSKDTLLKKYEEKQMINELAIKLNAHNQFLNTFVALGILGFVLLSACFIYPLYFSIKTKAYIFTSFLALTGINFLFEAMLEMQAGVLFFAFFFTLLSFVFVSKNKNVSQ